MVPIARSVPARACGPPTAGWAARRAAWIPSTAGWGRGGEGRPPARRRQVTHLGAGRLEHDLDRQMRGAVEPARCIDDLAGPLPGVLDHLLEIAPGLGGIDEQHRWLSRDKRDRREL